MAFEAYEAMCAALANIRYGDDPIPPDSGLPYLPRKTQRRHPVIKWVEQDIHHAQWALEHADALCTEAQYRYDNDQVPLPKAKCHDYLIEHMSEFPITMYDGEYNPAEIEYYGAFNFDWFRREKSAREGEPILPSEVHLVTRYRLSLLHKWLYLDKRKATWSKRGPPSWAFKPAYRQWIDDVFGKPINEVPELHMPTPIVNRPEIKLNLPKLPEWSAKTLVDKLWIQKLSYHHEADGVTSYVVFNSEQPRFAYRLFLSRQWNSLKPPLIVIMTNPSKADHQVNDQTINKITSYARAWGCGGFIVLNVFGYRATDPTELLATDDPVGLNNLVVIDSVIGDVKKIYRDKMLVVCAWGSLAPTLCKKMGLSSVLKVESILERHKVKPKAIELSNDGHPKHPLYLKGDLKPIPYKLDARH